MPNAASIPKTSLIYAVLIQLTVM